MSELSKGARIAYDMMLYVVFSEKAGEMTGGELRGYIKKIFGDEVDKELNDHLSKVK